MNTSQLNGEKARDAVIAYRSAVALMIITFAMVVLIPLGLAFNVIMLMVLEIPGRVEHGPGVTTLERLSGVLPYPVPAWAGLLCALALGILLVICWRPSRHHIASAPGAKLRLHISPLFIALLAIIGTFASATCAAFYQPLDGSFSWWWVNVAVYAGIAVVAFRHGARIPRKKKRRVSKTRPRNV
ncbi:hypothetical protein GY21_00730 [Cryobacterium roopkundense]|uniref:Transmembrane protein n=1 Tax=Cryobacterium roopkundense TaxID=1001240 RepID=A0A099JW54_9MICO|nr:hypothetical protein GY21_00730 [Cryobacterium roopkundense]